MGIYLLKFSACLLVFWLIYVFLLERQKMHHFKRFYLLGAFALSLLIPQLTITEYVEPFVADIETAPIFIPTEMNLVIETPIEQPPLINLETTLWFIYGLGAFIFLFRFVVNLIRLYRLISKNENISRSSFIYVLLKEYRIPHSFFNYIFLNKLKFESNNIPKEVLLHEETHAKQLHSLDIIVIELLQIVFWFHPLIYILKHHIKLNHEFLADHAVLKQGTDTSNYQKILLQFSSSTQNQQLASAINYSSIKKRFTVMKAQTSKTRIWVSSLLLLPIIAILYYSFAEIEYVEKDNSDIVEAIKSELEEANNLNTIYLDDETEPNLFLVTVEKNGNSIELKCESGCRWSHLILEPSTEPYIINDFGFSKGNTVDRDKFTFSIQPNASGVDIDGIKGTAWLDLNFSLKENQVQAINDLGMTSAIPPSKKEVLNYKTLDIKAISDKLTVNDVEYDVNNYSNVLNGLTKHWTRKDYKSSNIPELEISNCSQEFLDKLDSEFRKSDFFLITIQGIGKATPEMMKEYKDWIKQLNSNSSSLHIPLGTFERLIAIYDLMSEAQRNSVEPYPFLQEIRTNLYKVEPSIPTTGQFESWKNKKEFAIWLDGKHISNEELNNYSTKDIAHYVGSKVHKNARSKKFPQPFQFRLYTKEGFKKFYKESVISDYNTLTKKYSKAIDLYLKGPQTDNSELRILKIQADKLFNQFTKEDLKKYSILPAPPVPAENNSQVIQKPILWILINRNNQFLVDDEIATLENIENKLKKLAKQGKAGQLVSIKYDKETSKDVILQVQKLVKANKFKVVTYDISNIPPPPPPPSKKTKGGPNVDESQNSYNPTFLEYITDMEKDGATFYLDGKKITSSKAKSIAKTNKGKQTEMLTQKDANGKYIVKLSSSKNMDRQQKATDKQLAAYNKLAKHYNTILKENHHRILLKDVKKLKHIYNIMSDEQRKNAEPFPDFPKPPPSPEEPIIIEEQKVIPPPPPPIPDNATPEEVKRMKKVTEEYKKKYPKKGNVSKELIEVVEVPPPPKPESSLDFVIRMAKANAKFFYKLKPISSDKAIEILKKKPKTHINAQKTDSEQPLVYMSNKPIYIGVKEKILPMVNGKTIKSGEISMTINEIKKLKLTLPNNKITDFKLKIPGIKTELIKGNSITKTTLENLNSVKTGDYITLFDIKDDKSSKFSPIVIEIID